MVDFVVQSTNAQNERWTGIGFSENNRMVESDVVVGYVESNSRVYLKDMWTTSYLHPVIDSSQVHVYLELGQQNDP